MTLTGSITLKASAKPVFRKSDNSRKRRLSGSAFEAHVNEMNFGLGSVIGIGGSLAAPPLPHHLAYGAVPRRFERLG